MVSILTPICEKYLRTHRLRAAVPKKRFLQIVLVCFSFLASSLLSHKETAADLVDVWIGTGKTGIYYLTLDTDTGKMSNPTLAAAIKRPGFLAMHPNGETLYALDGADGGSVTALSITDPKEILKDLQTKRAELKQRLGAGHKSVKEINSMMEELASPSTHPYLKFINQFETGDGGAACVAIDQTATALMSAQYGGGSTTSYQVNEDGSIKGRVDVIEHGPGSGVNAQRQKTAHPHWVGTSPDNRFLMVPDLGLDSVVVYEIDHATAKLKPHSRVTLPPGSGPRHMKFHTSGKFAYVLNELTLTVSVFEYNAEDGSFKDIQLIETLPQELKDKHLNSAAEIRIHPSGKFAYTSNRGHDSICVFSIDPSTGKLTFVEHEHIRGATPRNFNLDPSGKWLIAAGQQSNTLSLFEVDQKTGELTFARKVVNVPAPICVLFGS